MITAHYIWPTPYHWPVYVIELQENLNVNLSSSASLNPQNKIALYFYFFVSYNVHLNIRMATVCVDSIFKAQFAILMTSLKLTTTTSFCIHCRIFISKNILFLSIKWN